MKKIVLALFTTFIFVSLTYAEENAKMHFYSSAYEDAEYYLKRASDYKRQNNYEAAREEYEKVIELNPAHWIAYTELAHIHTIKKDFHKAKSLCLKALEHNSENFMAWVMLGGCYHELGENPKKTEEAFRRSWSIRKNKAALQGLISTVGDYEKERRYLEAEKLITYLLSLNPPKNNRKDLEKLLKDIRKLKNK